MPHPELPLLIAPQSPIDESIYAVYAGLPSQDGTISDRLLPSPEQVERERTAFYVSDGTYLPDLRPTGLDAELLDEEIGQLENFKAGIEELSPNADVAQAYRWRVNERVANVRLAQAASAGDMRRFAAYNAFVYGRPDPAISEAVVDFYVADAEDKRQTGPYAVRAQADEVLERLSGQQRGDRAVLSPSAALFEAVQAVQFSEVGYFTLALAGVTMPEGKLTAETGDPILRQVGRNMGVDPLQLRDARGLTWSMHAAESAMLRPAQYSLLPVRFLGLGVGHEPTHLLEYQNGGRSALRLIQKGVDRFERGNEGRALIREQVAYPSFSAFADTPRWQMILRRFLGTALALGNDGQTADFRTVHPTINSLDRLYEVSKKPDNEDQAYQKADARSWSLLESIYKGTDGTTPYGRYGIYLAGNVACWQTLAEDVSLMNQGDRGKFDITNPRHRALMRSTGVLPNEEALV